jgi:hypothetical protein
MHSSGECKGHEKTQTKVKTALLAKLEYMYEHALNLAANWWGMHSSAWSAALCVEHKWISHASRAEPQNLRRNESIENESWKFSPAPRWQIIRIPHAVVSTCRW